MTYKTRGINDLTIELMWTASSTAPTLSAAKNGVTNDRDDVEYDDVTEFVNRKNKAVESSQSSTNSNISTFSLFGSLNSIKTIDVNRCKATCFTSRCWWLFSFTYDDTLGTKFSMRQNVKIVFSANKVRTSSSSSSLVKKLVLNERLNRLHFRSNSLPSDPHFLKTLFN